MSLPIRGVAVGRRPHVARASAGLSVSRVLAATAVLAAAGALYGATSSEAFRLERLGVSGIGRTSEVDVRAIVEGVVGERPNLFRVRTDEVATAIAELPAVRSADVRVILPDRLDVVVTERVPILVWAVGERRLLADADGRVLAEAEGREAGTLPVAEDGRKDPVIPAPGERLDATDLAVVRQLGALSPASIGSKASRLKLAVDDRMGWTITAEPAGWQAIFGVYASRIRTPDVVAAQVQCLASLLATDEARISTVYLAPSGDRCGTFRVRGD
jgi:cell division septal protein FtsQ